MFEDDRYIAFILSSSLFSFFFLSLLRACLLACLLTCLLAFRCPIDVGGFPVDVRGSFVDTCASPALTLAGHGAESK